MSGGGERGFTLVEVLVAFTILALILGGILQAITAGLAAERAASQATARLLEARSLVEAVGVDAPVTPGRREGRLADGAPWRLTVAPLEEPAARLTAFRVELAVGDRARPDFVLQTVRLGPGSDG